MGKRFVLFLLIVAMPFFSNAQTLTGTTGLLNIPSADVQADGTFIMGCNYLPEINQPMWGFHTGNYYFNLTFLPFLEVAYKCTLIRTKSTGKYTQQDRGVSVRLQVLKEKEYFPAVTIGMHDVCTHTKCNQYFGATYVVFTKHFDIDRNFIGLTSGYGTALLKHNEFVGLFGGISVSPSFFTPATFMAEYDCKGVNVGGSLLLFRHVYFLAMAQRLKYFAGGVAYKIYL